MLGQYLTRKLRYILEGPSPLYLHLWNNVNIPHNDR